MRLLRLFPPPYPSTLLFLNLFPCLGDLSKVGTEVFNWYAIPYLAADLEHAQGAYATALS